MSNMKIVQEFIAAFNRDELEAAYALMCDDIVYHNIPMAPLYGVAAVRQFFRDAVPMTDNNWQVLHIAENGAAVMTERLDKMRLGGKPVSIPVMGVFEIDNGRIKAWRDYFDLGMFERQLV